MNRSSGQTNIHRLAAIGMMSAVAFVSNYLSIPIGDIARVHFGNIFCVLAGLLLGPVSGGLSGGLGAFFYDLTNPLYADEAVVTFAMKFVIGFLAGTISRIGGRRGESMAFNLMGAATGSAAYVLLYLGKNFIKEYYLLRNPMETVMTKLAIKAGTSVLNAGIAVAVAVLLAPVLIQAFKRAGLYERLFAPPAAGK